MYICKNVQKSSLHTKTIKRQSWVNVLTDSKSFPTQLNQSLKKVLICTAIVHVIKWNLVHFYVNTHSVVCVWGAPAKWADRLAEAAVWLVAWLFHRVQALSLSSIAWKSCLYFWPHNWWIPDAFSPHPPASISAREASSNWSKVRTNPSTAINPHHCLTVVIGCYFQSALHKSENSVILPSQMYSKPPLNSTTEIHFLRKDLPRNKTWHFNAKVYIQFPKVPNWEQEFNYRPNILAHFSKEKTSLIL